MPTDKTFEIDRLLGSNNARAILSIPGAGSSTTRSLRDATNANSGLANASSRSAANRSTAVVGLVTNPFGFGGSADYSSPFESATQQQASDFVRKAEAAFRQIAATFGSDTSAIPQLSIQTVANTISAWTSTSRPTFNLSLCFLTLDATDDVRIPVQRITNAVFPQFSPTSLTTTIKSPLGYLPVFNQDNTSLTAKNTCAIQIGSWFRAAGQVITNFDFQFSEAVNVNNGAPLFATGTITFQPFRMISASEMTGYIKG